MTCSGTHRLAIRLLFLLGRRSPFPTSLQEEAMSRTTRLTALAAVLVPLAAACWSNDRSDTAEGSSAGATPIASTESSPTATSSTAGGTAEAPAASTMVPSYADADRAFHRGRYEEAAGMFEAYTEHTPDD